MIFSYYFFLKLAIPLCFFIITYFFCQNCHSYQSFCSFCIIALTRQFMYIIFMQQDFYICICNINLMGVAKSDSGSNIYIAFYCLYYQYLTDMSRLFRLFFAQLVLVTKSAWSLGKTQQTLLLDVPTETCTADMLHSAHIIIIGFY